MQTSLSAMDQMKKINIERDYKAPFKLSRFPNPVVELMGIGAVDKNHLQPPRTMFLQQIILKITI